MMANRRVVSRFAWCPVPDWTARFVLGVMLYSAIACPCANAMADSGDNADSTGPHTHHAMHGAEAEMPPTEDCGGSDDGEFCFSSPAARSDAGPALDAADSAVEALPFAAFLHEATRPEAPSLASHSPPEPVASPTARKDRLDE